MHRTALSQSGWSSKQNKYEISINQWTERKRSATFAKAHTTENFGDAIIIVGEEVPIIIIRRGCDLGDEMSNKPARKNNWNERKRVTKKTQETAAYILYFKKQCVYKQHKGIDSSSQKS